MPSKFNRRSIRYDFTAPVDVSLNHRRIAYGTLIDISVDGLGFKASPPLVVGETYLVSIRGISAFQCKIMHCSDYNRYGARLLLTDNRKRKLAKRLEAAVNELGLKPSD